MTPFCEHLRSDLAAGSIRWISSPASRDTRWIMDLFYEEKANSSESWWKERQEDNWSLSRKFKQHLTNSNASGVSPSPNFSIQRELLHFACLQRSVTWIWSRNCLIPQKKSDWILTNQMANIANYPLLENSFNLYWPIRCLFSKILMTNKFPAEV